MKMKYWATRKQKTVGPFETREAALKAFRETFPFKGPDYMAKSPKNSILTGYGEFGPYSDLRWDFASA
jgi:hypothetical protein